MQTMQPDKAMLLNNDRSTANMPTDQWQLVDTRLVNYGDVIRVETDSVIAADGILIGNEGTIDESCMNGESVPVVKGVGSLVVVVASTWEHRCRSMSAVSCTRTRPPRWPIS
jgi:P-type E1-E2 ATPase